MITEDYVSFETAKLLKEKGFDEKSTSYYQLNSFGEPVLLFDTKQFHNRQKNRYCRCTLQMAMKWLREVHNTNIDIVSVWNQKQFEYQVFIVTPENAKHCYIDNKLYLAHEEAVEAAIKYCLENLI